MIGNSRHICLASNPPTTKQNELGFGFNATLVPSVYQIILSQTKRTFQEFRNFTDSDSPVEGHVPSLVTHLHSFPCSEGLSSLHLSTSIH